VHRRQQPEVLEIRFTGIAEASPRRRWWQALAAADAIVLCPSNPLVFRGTHPGRAGQCRDLISAARLRGVPVAAVSRSSAGAPSRVQRTGCSLPWGSSRRRWASRGCNAGLVDVFVLDALDAGSAAAVRALGPRTHVTEHDHGRRRVPGPPRGRGAGRTRRRLSGPAGKAHAAAAAAHFRHQAIVTASASSSDVRSKGRTPPRTRTSR